MSYEFICPYCFKPILDSDVWFRSEKVNTGMNEYIPVEYDDAEDFEARYEGDDKDILRQRIEEWEFFAESEDSEYTKFWKEFGGTTEKNPEDEVLGVKAYHRRLINPNDPKHCKYLKKQSDGGWLILDEQGMTSGIQLKTGEVCNRRVCPHEKCHNPLPNNYGKSPVKFTTIIGIVGAGKTVYLSQLLRHMKTYSSKAGLSAIVRNSGTVTFLNENKIEPRLALPTSTPANKMQQPLFYELIRGRPDGTRVTETFVLYDVAGEVFKSEDLVDKFAPFIKHADGLVLLIDPMQFDSVNRVVEGGKQLDDPTSALDAIHGIVSGDTLEKCTIPCAVCLSKADEDAVQNALSASSPTLVQHISQKVEGIKGRNRLYLPIFNAKQYNPIVKELDNWIVENASNLAQELYDDYTTYSFFAFTALGCTVIEGEIDGKICRYPKGPIVPCRVEEPLLWLFHKLGYIETNERLYEPGKEIVRCPSCGGEDTDELPAGSFIYEGRFLHRRRIAVNRVCNNPDCRHKWMNDVEDVPNERNV